MSDEPYQVTEAGDPRDRIANQLPLPAGLSTTHRRILRLIAQGYDMEAISDELGIAESTCRTHVQRIRAKVAHPTARMPELPACARERGVVF